MYNIQGNIDVNVALRNDIQNILNEFKETSNQADIASTRIDLIEISEPRIPGGCAVGSTVQCEFSIECVIHIDSMQKTVVRTSRKSGEVDFEQDFFPARQSTSLNIDVECTLKIAVSGYDLLEFDLLDRELTADTPKGCWLSSITLKR